MKKWDSHRRIKMATREASLVGCVRACGQGQKAEMYFDHAGIKNKSYWDRLWTILEILSQSIDEIIFLMGHK